MKSSAITATVIALITVSLIGAGYAVTYYGVTESTSSLRFDEYSICITAGDSSTPISSPITVAGPTYTKVDDTFTGINSSGNPVTVYTSTITVQQSTVSPANTYKLKIVAPDGVNPNVRAKIVMDDNRTWTFISSISITAGSNTVTWKPTGSTWTEESQLFSAMSAGTYNLTITVNYKETTFTDVHTQAENVSFTTIGMKLVLALSDDDPVPQS